MIHVCFGLYDKTGRYSKLTGTAMLSLFENIFTPPQLPSVTVHILHDNTLTQDNRDKFIYLAGQYGQLVKFYNVEELCAEKIQEFINLIPVIRTSRLSIAAMYRLLIPQLLSPEIDKVIYLDSDIIVNLDITELWQIEVGDKILGAITHRSIGMIDAIKKRPICVDGFVNPENSFNSGVLLINLKLSRDKEKILHEGIEFIGKNPNNKFLDQDILNYCFSTETLQLPLKFNQFVREARINKELPTKKIYHYIVDTLGLNMNDPFNRLWMTYFIKTPWFEENVFGRLFESFQQIYTNLNVNNLYNLIRFSATMSGKTRAFFMNSENVEQFRELFSIRADEDIIIADNPKSLQNLATAMRVFQYKKFFFIIVPNFRAVSKVLSELGFVQNKDFINGLEFLPVENSSKLDSHLLIKTI